MSRQFFISEAGRGCKLHDFFADFQAYSLTVTTMTKIAAIPTKFLVNPFAPGDFAEKRVLKLVEWFSGHCRAIKS